MERLDLMIPRSLLRMYIFFPSQMRNAQSFRAYFPLDYSIINCLSMDHPSSFSLFDLLTIKSSTSYNPESRIEILPMLKTPSSSGTNLIHKVIIPRRSSLHTLYGDRTCLPRRWYCILTIYLGNKMNLNVGR